MISLLRLPLASEQDVFSARQRAREAARQLGFDGHDEIRVATAVSELGRAAVGQGGVATLTIALVPGRPPQLVIDVEGDNIDLDEGGAYGSAVSASRRLMDSFTVLAGPPTAVRLTKFVSHAPSGFTPGELARVQDMLAGLAESSPFDELRAQNQELVATLDQLRAQQEQLLQLNQELAETNNGVVAMYTQLSTELEDTNRGVVALYAELDEKSVQLKEASEAKSRFLASVSHELRSPINSVLAMARFMRDPDSEPLTAPQAHQIDLIAASAEELLGLVNDLLDLAKAEAGRIEAHTAVVDLGRLIGDLCMTMRPLAAPGVDLVVVPFGDAPVMIETDGALFAQLLRNLIGNGLKYTEAGEVRVTVHERMAGNQIAIAVSDTGVGIDSEHHDLIFEEFYQIPGPHQTKHHSTGLGLPYVRRIADVLGASVAVESEPGHGSTFTVTAPIQWLQTPHLSPARSPEPAPDGDRPVEFGTVLVVDDEPGFRHLLRQMLQQCSSRVIEAEDAESALRIMRESRPDLVLLDLRMPGADGETVLARAAVEDGLRDIPIAVVTSVDPGDQRPAALARAAAVVGKAGLTRETLIRRLRSVVGDGDR